MREYQVTLNGLTPLLMHWDNLDWDDELNRWKLDQGKLAAQDRDVSKAGDDRTPAWRWLGSIYHDDERVCIPADNIQTMLRDGAAMMLVSNGGKKTFKAQSQSGLMPVDAYWPLIVRGQEIPWAPLLALKEEKHFGLHIAKARELGFRLFLKRARIGTSKHVRVRARFDEWKVTGTIRVTDEQITQSILQQFFDLSGRYKGIGDWRPGSKTPGLFGMFEAALGKV